MNLRTVKQVSRFHTQLFPVNYKNFQLVWWKDRKKRGVGGWQNEKEREAWREERLRFRSREIIMKSLRWGENEGEKVISASHRADNHFPLLWMLSM